MKPEEKSENQIQGCLQIYTGNGKGKTTAALGLALRAAGRGKKIFIGQFLKGQDYGELHAVKKLSQWITLRQFGRSGFIHISKDLDSRDIAKAREGLEICRNEMLSNRYDIIILDEINVVLHFGLLTVDEVHQFLDSKPKPIEIILTGRYAPDSLIERADLVTEMKEIKHYYSRGAAAREGIEK